MYGATVEVSTEKKDRTRNASLVAVMPSDWDEIEMYGLTLGWYNNVNLYTARNTYRFKWFIGLNITINIILSEIELVMSSDCRWFMITSCYKNITWTAAILVEHNCKLLSFDWFCACVFVPFSHQFRFVVVNQHRLHWRCRFHCKYAPHFVSSCSTKITNPSLYPRLWFVQRLPCIDASAIRRWIPNDTFNRETRQSQNTERRFNTNMVSILLR